MSPFEPAPEHEHFNEDVSSYLLGALPAPEKAAFEIHLSECPLCRADVERLQIAADALPASVPPVLPPPALKGRIMGAVEAEAALLAAAGARADRPEVAAPAPTPRRRGLTERFGHLLRPAFALPAALALLVLGGGSGVLLDRALRPEAEPRVEVRRVPVAQPPRVRRIPAEVDRSELPRGRVRLEVTGERGRLVGRGMSPAPRGRIYQVWLVREGSRTPVATSALFGARRDGRAVVAVPGSLENVAQILVNHEPLGGSTTPTKTPFISVEL